MKFELYEVIKLIKDFKGIKSGSIGTIVEIYDDEEGFKVEFLDKDG